MELDKILAQLGVPLNFKGDRIDAMREGAAAVYNIMLERITALEKELANGKKELDKRCNKEPRSTT